LRCIIDVLRTVAQVIHINEYTNLHEYAR